MHVYPQLSYEYCIGSWVIVMVIHIIQSTIIIIIIPLSDMWSDMSLS